MQDVGLKGFGFSSFSVHVLLQGCKVRFVVKVLRLGFSLFLV